MRRIPAAYSIQLSQLGSGTKSWTPGVEPGARSSVATVLVGEKIKRRDVDESLAPMGTGM
jgi:hypothetical protein